MSKIGWLVNDCLDSFPGVITFWHNLLEQLPELIDKTNGYTNYTILVEKNLYLLLSLFLHQG